MLGFSAVFVEAVEVFTFPPCAEAMGGTTTVCGLFDDAGDCADETFEALADG
jgi:hypothetical protein